jgi:hypothetical protein
MSSWRTKAAFWAATAFLLATLLSRLVPSEEDLSEHEPRPEGRRASEVRVSEQGFAFSRSLAVAFVGMFLFAAGAALGGAFTASADEGMAPAALSETTTTTDESTTTDSSTDEATTDGATTVAEPATTNADEPPPIEGPTTIAPSPAPGGDDGTKNNEHSQAGGASAPAPVTLPTGHQAKRAPESSEGAGAVIWLHRTLPDPTPPARRLSPRFAGLLRATSRAAGLHWPLVLAVLRAEGRTGQVPASKHELESLVRRIALHRVNLTPEIRALARYDRAVRLRSLVEGLEAAKPLLERRVLRDRRIDIYPAGRSDIVSNRVDVRVLVTIRYLAITFRQVGVSSLISGHRIFARPRVVSAHVDGLAVDIATVGGVTVVGNQSPNGITERAVEALMRMPSEVAPQQIISLLGLGGASFALADHNDHIHVGF